MEKMTKYFNPAAEIRVETRGEKKVLTGLAIPYEVRSQKLYGSMYEYINRNAFADALDSDIYAFVNHDPDKVLARSSAGTLILRNTEEGVRFEIDPPNSTLGKDITESITRGDITGMSFGFRVDKGNDSWSKEDDVDVRRVHKAKLFEISVVTYPAYTATDVHARSNEGMVEEYVKMVKERQKHDQEWERMKMNVMTID